MKCNVQSTRWQHTAVDTRTGETPGDSLTLWPQVRCNHYPQELFAAAIAEDRRAESNDDGEVKDSVVLLFRTLTLLSFPGRNRLASSQRPG